MHEHKCCCSNQEYTRKLLTKTEQLEKLKKYEQDITQELQAVQEKIRELSA